MKIRNGFVSNSSSTSFVIGCAAEPLLAKALEATKSVVSIPIKEVAREMLKASDREEYIRWFDKLPENIKYIVFQSCNYETQIMDIGTGVLILTCNNEQAEWEKAFDIIEERFSTTYRGIEETDEYDELVCDSPYYKNDGCIQYLFHELGINKYPLYTTFSFEDIAEKYGPAAFISNRGVILYEGKNRICIK